MSCLLTSSAQLAPVTQCSAPQAAIHWKPAQRCQHRVELTGGCHRPTVAKGKWGFRGLWVLNLHGYFYIETFLGLAQQPCSGPWGQGAGTAASLCF